MESKSRTTTWQYKANKGIASVDINNEGDKIILGTLSNDIFCLNQNGEVNWQYRAGNQVWRVGINNLGDKIAASTGNTNFLNPHNREVYFFNELGQLLWHRELKASTWGLALSGDGSTLALGTDAKKFLLLDSNNNKLWDESIKGVWAYAWGWSASLSFTGEYIALGAANGSLRLLNRNGGLIRKTKLKGDVFSVSVSSNALTVAAGDSNGSVYVFDQYGSLLWDKLLEDDLWAVKVSADGERIIVGGDPKVGHIKVFNRDGGDLVWRRSVDGSVSAIDVGNKSRDIVVGTDDGRIYVFDEDGSIRHTAQAAKKVRDVAISAYGDVVVAVSMDTFAYGFQFEIGEHPSSITDKPLNKSLMNKEFGEWLRFFRNQTRYGPQRKFLSGSKFAELLDVEEDMGRSFSATNISYWETGSRSISQNERKLLLGIIRILHRYKGISSVEEADIFLKSGYYSPLTSEEKIFIFGS